MEDVTELAYGLQHSNEKSVVELAQAYLYLQTNYQQLLSDYNSLAMQYDGIMEDYYQRYNPENYK